MSKSRRKWWIGGVLLLAGGLLVYQWMRPRPIHVALKDDTTLTIAAITTGTEHSRSLPITSQLLKSQFAAGRWRWPARTHSTPQPSTVFWFDGQETASQLTLILVDRNGWRWGIESGTGNALGSLHSFRQIETDGTARLEILGQKGLLGSVILPIATAVPTAPLPAPLTYRPVKSMFPPAPPAVSPNGGPPDPYPIRQTVGPLEATLHAVDTRIVEMHGHHVSEGTLRLDTRWNNEPFPPQLGTATITDQFGRSDPSHFGSQLQFQVVLPPQGAIWNLHLQMYRNPASPLDSEEVTALTPTFPRGATSFAQDGLTGGNAWRATVVPTGQISVASRFQFGPLRFQESAPILIVEADPMRPLRIRVEPVDRQGKVLATAATNYGLLPPNIVAFRCPDFDAAQGHTLRVGIESPRLVQFRFRPNVVATEKTKSPASSGPATR